MMRRAAWLGLVATACIIPDREISIEGGPANEFAVRILERTPLPPEMVEICNAEADVADLTFCPPVRRSLRSGLIRTEDGGDFCICPGEDNRAIDWFSIYAEDGDQDGDSPRDTLYGQFLLDPDPLAEEPTDNLAFHDYWNYCDPGESIAVDDDGEDAGGRTAPGQARDKAPQTVFRIDDGTGKVDLCNGDGPLARGLHTLQFMVTDRPFFVTPFADEGGEGEGRQKCGVPDIAAGATYDTVNYVFECVDALDSEDPRSENCDCD